MCCLFRNKQTVSLALLAWYVVSGLPVPFAGAARNTTTSGVCCCASSAERNSGACSESNGSSACCLPASTRQSHQCCRSSRQSTALSEATEACCIITDQATSFESADSGELPSRTLSATERDSTTTSTCCRESDTTATEVCNLSCNCGCRDKQQQADSLTDGRVTLQVTGVDVDGSPVCESLFAMAEPECRRLFFPPSTPPG